jgi:hypothetical protein
MLYQLQQECNVRSDEDYCAQEEGTSRHDLLMTLHWHLNGKTRKCSILLIKDHEDITTDDTRIMNLLSGLQRHQPCNHMVEQPP